MKKLLTLFVLLASSCAPLPAQNTLAGNLTVQQSVKLTGDITPPTLSADVDDYAPANFSAATFLRISADAPRAITGLAGGADGRVVWLSNIGGYPISLAHAFSGSAAANRFDLGGANYELAAGNGLGIWYDATASRWRPLSGLAAGGGGGGSGTVTSVAVSTANGVSATVANPTTTPNLTFSLGAITPSSVAASGNITGANLSGINTGDQSDATLTFSDVITNNVSTVRHGFAPKLPGDATRYLDGSGAWSTPAGGSVGSGTVTSVSVVSANGVSGSVANATTTPAITLSLGAITPTSVAATGAVTGSNLSGTNTGDQTSVTGNAGTATKLATARTINGVAFDGTANITVTVTAADAGAEPALGNPVSSGQVLSSTTGGVRSWVTLPASSVTSVFGRTGAVTAQVGDYSKSDVGLGNVENTALSTWAGSSNVTTLGTIASGTWHGAAIADSYIASAATWNAKVSFPGFGTTGTTAAVGNDARLSDARAPLAHNQAWNTITTTPTTLAGYGITDAQPLDSDLTALAGASSTGLWTRTGSGTGAVRTIAGTPDQVTVTNGDGVSGNPTLSLPQSIATTSTPQFTRIGIGKAADASAPLDVIGSSLPVVRITRTTSATNDTASGLQLTARSSSDASDGFGALALIYIEDSGTASPQPLGGFGAYRDGADNSGAFTIKTTTAGSFAERMRISSSGLIRFGAYGAGTLATDSSGNVTASSDSRLKNVTGVFTRGLVDVIKLQPKTYRWKADSGMNPDDENVGFIAQDVRLAIPEAVCSTKTSEVEEDDGTGKKVKKTKRVDAEFLSLSDRPIIAALVNAVKELKAENDALSARIAALENGKAAK